MTPLRRRVVEHDGALHAQPEPQRLQRRTTFRDHAVSERAVLR